MGPTPRLQGCAVALTLGLLFAMSVPVAAQPDLPLIWGDPAPGYAPEAEYAISPFDPTLVTVTHGLVNQDGVAVSRDGASTFSAVDGPWAPSRWVWDAHDANRIWAADLDQLLTSADGGLTWTAAAWPFPGQTPTVLEAPNEGAPVYVYTEFDEGWCIHMSHDLGDTWYTMHEDNGGTMKQLDQVLITRNNNQTWIYALAAVRPNPNAEPTHISVVRSTLGGLNWNLMQPDPNGQTPAFGDDLSVHPDAATRLHVSGRLDDDPAGMVYPLVSTNGGTFWSKVTGPWGDGEASVHPRQDGSLVAFSRLGVHVSEDYGDTWNARLPDLTDWPLVRFPHIKPDQVRFNGQDLDRIWIPHEGLLLRSEDGGLSWSFTTSGLRGEALRRIEVGHPWKAVAAGEDVAVLFEHGRPTDIVGARPGLRVRIGHTEVPALLRWGSQPGSDPRPELRHTPVDPWQEFALPAGTTTLHDVVFEAGPYWQNDPQPLHLLAAIDDSTVGLWSRADLTAPWSDLQATFRDPRSLLAPWPGYVLVLARDSLHVSDDGGDTFTSHPIPATTDGIRAHPEDDGMLLRYDLSAGDVAISTDHGASWEAVPELSGDPLQAPPALGPMGDIHYVTGNALWRHNPFLDETEWVRDLTSDAVFDLQVGADRSTYIATWEGVVVGMSPAGIANDVHGPAEGLPSRITLQPVYPNPFNGTAMVTLDLAAAGTLRLTVHDMLGREVATRHQSLAMPGRAVFSLDGSSWASGTYLVRARMGADISAPRRVTLVK